MAADDFKKNGRKIRDHNDDDDGDGFFVRRQTFSAVYIESIGKKCMG